MILGCRGRKAPYRCDRLRERGTSFPLWWELLFGETIREIVFLKSWVVKGELLMSGFGTTDSTDLVVQDIIPTNLQLRSDFRQL